MVVRLRAALRRDFGLHRDFLWGLCYRMTGSAADADDLVQMACCHGGLTDTRSAEVMAG